MGMNVTEKILKEHLVSGDLEPGKEIGIRIDQTLTQDATGTMAYLQFEAMGLASIKNELAVSYVDHNTVQIGHENADDHAYLRSTAAKYGAVFSKPGNGICHQLHLERFGAPGKTLLGSDSHTPTAGALSMFAVGAGGLDVAVAMGGAAFCLTVPRVIKIELKGSLKPWVSAKDVILKVLEMFSTKGNVGCVFEYAGSGLKHLDVPERATIANMGAECGVTTSVFPSDETTNKFLNAQGRAGVWKEIVADADAEYDRVVKINLADIEPLAAAPHSPGNVQPLASLAGVRVDQILIGSCTNSSYRDLKTVARILADKKVHPNVTLGIASGSRQVLQMLAKEGLLSIFIEAGARILENACGFCIGNSMSPVSGAVSLRTSNRNFEGRSGTMDARVYLVSPAIAAVAAVQGRLLDPSASEDLKYPKIKQPKEFLIDDSMFIQPPEDRAGVRVVKGPNIGEVPKNEPMPAELTGPVAIKAGDSVTTDHIMPAGQRLKYRSNVAAYSKFVFENIDSQFAERAMTNLKNGLHNFIIAGVSYGQGSSREHAALCPMYLGVKAVIAKSIERIHCANLINYGIIPLLFKNSGDYKKVEQGDSLEIKDILEVIKGSQKAVVNNQTKNIEIPVKLELSERQQDILLAGGLLNFMSSGK
ncbi:aconitate hydratase [Verrucomicrobiota bacterium]